MPLFYISFATDDALLGATVVEAANEAGAFIVATARGLNPGGQAAMLAVPDDLTDDETKEMLSYLNRLVGKDEIRANGGARLKDTPQQIQDRFEEQATVVCNDCNQPPKQGRIH